MKKRIVQLLAAAHTGDATGNQAMLLDKLFNELGYESSISALTIDKPLQEKVQPFDDFQKEYSPARDIIWMHFNLPSPLSEFFVKASGKRVMEFHNFTPPEYSLPFNPMLSKTMQKARAELITMKDSCDLALGVSNFNCSLLKDLRFRNVACFPLIFDPAMYENKGSPSIERLLKGPTKNILFVGRIAPNKKIEDLMSCYAFIKKNIRDDCRLIIGGKYNHDDEYFRFLIRHIGQFRAEGIMFTGELTQEEMAQYYPSSNLFLSFSEHEGFFVPLLESFYYGLPVIARDAAAVSETAGGAACLFEGRDIVRAAEIAVELFDNKELRDSLIAKGRERLKYFMIDKAKTRLKGFLEVL